MKVKYLIKKLKKYDPETEVVLERPNRCLDSLEKIEELKIIKNFWKPESGFGKHMNLKYISEDEMGFYSQKVTNVLVLK